MKSANASGLVSVCYPFFTLESILPRLGQRSYVRTNRGVNQAELGQLNCIALGPMQVPVAVEMGRTKLPLAEADSIQVGDVICMQSNKTDPCVVFVGDEPKYYARPFAAETGKVGVQVVGAVPSEIQEQYHS